MYRPTLRLAVLLAAMGLALSATLVGPAQAADTHYANCDALHQDFKHGVSKSATSARAQVREGYGLPASGKYAKRVYAANKANLDRDKDGTACEA